MRLIDMLFQYLCISAAELSQSLLRVGECGVPDSSGEPLKLFLLVAHAMLFYVNGSSQVLQNSLTEAVECLRGRVQVGPVVQNVSAVVSSLVLHQSVQKLDDVSAKVLLEGVHDGRRLRVRVAVGVRSQSGVDLLLGTAELGEVAVHKRVALYDSLGKIFENLNSSSKNSLFDLKESI